MTHDEERVWIIAQLKADMPGYGKIKMPQDAQAQKDLLRAMMNVRMPGALREDILDVQEAYMRKENMLKGIVDEKTIEPCKSDPRLAIWQGDITRLQVDAIVNAANSGMTGCYIPMHNCIDNCIHTAAGIRLRLKCAEIMQKQGHEEPTGQAKITDGYALPARHVIHTVGPIVEYGELRDEHKDLLRSCYNSILRLAEDNELRSVAFCCISTGVFMFPAEEAAKIAVATVKEYLDKQSLRYSEIGSYLGSEPGEGDTEAYRGIEKVIFNVFSDRDRKIYEDILG